MFKKTIYFFISFLLLVTSCKTPEDVIYFSKDPEIKKFNQAQKPYIFSLDDEITIYVSALDEETVKPFNLGISLNTENNDSPTSTAPKYVVDEGGYIHFPVIGKIKAVGLDRFKLQEVITQRLKEYVTDPLVTVSSNSFRITILGEVNAPGSFLISDEKTTILEALGMAGDLTIEGRRNDITVIRRKDTINTFHKVDLTKKELFNSPVFYLNKNDVVYVEPNEKKVRSSKYSNTTFGVSLSVIGVLLSAIAIIAR